MRKFLAALTLSTTVLSNSYVPLAQAQNWYEVGLEKICAIFSSTTLKVINDSIVICKKDTTEESFVENIYIYQPVTKTPDNFTVSLAVFDSGINLITIHEHSTRKIAQFNLNGRKFKNWVASNATNIEIVNKYRKSVDRKLLRSLKNGSV